MFYAGKIYPVKRASAAVQAAFNELVGQQAAKLHNPLAAFLERVAGLSEAERAAALSAFIAARRDEEFPEVYRIAAQNSLPSARFLVEHLIPDFAGEVTEDNKALFLKAIQLHHADPERERILEIKEMRNAQAQ